MANQAIKKGDYVKWIHDTEAPEMYVASDIDPNGMYLCQWFNTETKEFFSVKFPGSDLEDAPVAGPH